HEVEAPTLPAIDALVLVRHERAGSDQAHLATKDVQELGELVEVGLPEELPDAGDARVVRHLEEALGALVELHQLRLHRVRAVAHGAELDDLEGLAVAADAALAEQHRALRVDLD